MTDSNITIRLGKLSDLTGMQKMFVDTVTTICTADYDDRQIALWASGVDNKERWNDIMAKQFVLVAQHKAKIVGFATLEKGNYIDLLYVHKDYQRLGIAQPLLIEITNEAERLRQTTLTTVASKTARQFFEKKGFIILKEQTHLKQGVEIINYKMAKQL